MIRHLLHDDGTTRCGATPTHGSTRYATRTRRPLFCTDCVTALEVAADRGLV